MLPGHAKVSHTLPQPCRDSRGRFTRLRPKLSLRFTPIVGQTDDVLTVLILRHGSRDSYVGSGGIADKDNDESTHQKTKARL